MTSLKPSGNKYGILGSLHRALISNSRAKTLVSHLEPLFENGSNILDVGCGHGLVAKKLSEARTDLTIKGIDIVVRDDCLINASPYDGQSFPLPTNSVDYVLFVDVLHHTRNPKQLLREASRVANKGVIVKDHQVEGLFAWTTLWFLDWAGNKPYGIGLTYNYWTRSEWVATFESLGLTEVIRETRLNMYPQPFRLFFDRSLHFVEKLACTSTKIRTKTPPTIKEPKI